MYFNKLLLPILLLCLCFCTKVSAAITGDTAVYARTFCSNQLVIINNHIYSPLNPGGLEVIPGGAFNGTDSIFYVKLSFAMPVQTEFHTTICEGDTIYINNRPYHQGHFQDTEIFENAASNGCDSIINVSISFEPQPYSYLEDTLCEYETLVINGHTYDINNNTGLEILRNASYKGCDSLVYVSLRFRQSWVYLGEDRSLVEGDSVCIEIASRYDAQQIKWTPTPPCSPADCPSFCVDQLSAGRFSYGIVFTDKYGCTSTDEVNVQVSSEHLVYAPNVFGPEQDEPNNRFFIRSDVGVTKVNHLVIFDRWGEPVFEQFNMPNDDSAYDLGWDGTWKNQSLPEDVYGWWAELESFQGRKFTKSGDVTIVR